MIKWITRRAHSRIGKQGKSTNVRKTYIFRAPKEDNKSISYRSACPECGAQIISVHMPNGGWSHFEGAKGLERVKHPCFNRGNGLSKRPPEDMEDLFNLAVEANRVK